MIHQAIKGAISYLPGVYAFVHHRPKARGNIADSARYSYGVWLKHLTLLSKNGLNKVPEVVAEIGPGGTLGVGLAAILSGVRRYYALDIVEKAYSEYNLLIFDELVNLFRKREGRVAKGWPDYDHYLDANLFPSHILTRKVLCSSLTQERIESIRNELMAGNEMENEFVNYIVPWNDKSSIAKESVDLILSHSVLEHIDTLENSFFAFYHWIKHSGLMSHQIDFRSHGVAKKWNGHWAYSSLLWKVITGKRPYLINRQPLSKHVKLMKENGFKILLNQKRRRFDGIKRSQLTRHWRFISEDDLTCSGAFIIATKTANNKQMHPP